MTDSFEEACRRADAEQTADKEREKKERIS